jgi:hypothetical protein
MQVCASRRAVQIVRALAEQRCSGSIHARVSRAGNESAFDLLGNMPAGACRAARCPPLDEVLCGITETSQRSVRAPPTTGGTSGQSDVEAKLPAAVETPAWKDSRPNEALRYLSVPTLSTTREALAVGAHHEERVAECIEC